MKAITISRAVLRKVIIVTCVALLAISSLTSMSLLNSADIANAQTALVPLDRSFYNPIGSGADPHITLSNGWYHSVRGSGTGLYVQRSQSLEGIRSAASIRVFDTSTQTNCCNIWAPVIKQFNNKWYIYYSADRGLNNYEEHRMYVLESLSNDPLGPYQFRGQLANSGWSGRYAIDGTAFLFNGSYYFVWSGKTANIDHYPQHLYISRMSNPYTLSGTPVLISSPTYPWECTVRCLNENPEVLIRGGVVSIVFSADASWTNAYKTGIITNRTTNLMNAGNWGKNPSPQMQSTGAVFGPGGASFTTSPDLSQDWVIYHASYSAQGGWSGRQLQAQRFYWNSDNTPRFNAPINPGLSTAIPSGTPLTCDNCNNWYNWGSASGGALVSGQWNHNSATAVSNQYLTADQSQIFLRYNPANNYTYSISAKLSGSGTTNTPLYGIYAAYKDKDNYIVAYLDVKNQRFSSYSVTSGVARTWVHTPVSFTNFDEYHTFKAVASPSERLIHLYMDDVLMHSRGFGGNSAQVGVITQDTKAVFNAARITLP